MRVPIPNRVGWRKLSKVNGKEGNPESRKSIFWSEVDVAAVPESAKKRATFRRDMQSHKKKLLGQFEWLYAPPYTHIVLCCWSPLTSYASRLLNPGCTLLVSHGRPRVETFFLLVSKLINSVPQRSCPDVVLMHAVILLHLYRRSLYITHCNVNVYTPWTIKNVALYFWL